MTTLEELSLLNKVNIETVEHCHLIDIETIYIDPSVPAPQRMLQYLERQNTLSKSERKILVQAYQNPQVKVWYKEANKEVSFVKTLINGISRLQEFKI